MYAFGPLPRQKRTGRVIGTHQKIDRVARRHLSLWVPETAFPAIKDILHFEGGRGPDALKLKGLGEDKPRHFIDPKNIGPDDELLWTIAAHQRNLTNSLNSGDTTRAAFEAAWLAHAVTDGLTPAHHDPFDEEVSKLRDGEELPKKFRQQLIMTGNGSHRQFVRNNWQYWGAKGIMTTHTLFEAGIASAAKPLTFKDAAANAYDITELKKRGFRSIYIDMIHTIDELAMYERFKRDGWTRVLARQTTRSLMPTIIHAVELAWLESYIKTGKELR
jgi:hypothetical protein